MLTGKFISINDYIKKKKKKDFPGDSAVKNLIFNAGDEGLIPGHGNMIPHVMQLTCSGAYKA